MMNVRDFARIAGAQALCLPQPEREITGGYVCDLLSHVMGRGVPDMAWITVQTHMNVIAVASLLDFACVIVPESIAVDPAIVEKAQQEGIALLSSEKTAYELVCLLDEQGVAPAKK
jgi:serine kinase of HPr protein (carbohydrate metabolism regulator)